MFSAQTLAKVDDLERIDKYDVDNPFDIISYLVCLLFYILIDEIVATIIKK